MSCAASRFPPTIISHVALVYRDDSAIAFGQAMPALGVGVDLLFVISGFVIFESATRMIKFLARRAGQ